MLFKNLTPEEIREKKIKKGYEARKYLYPPKTEHDWIFPYTGTDEDFVKLFAALFLYPAFIFIVIAYVHIFSSELEEKIILITCYVVIDTCKLIGYIRDMIIKKKRMEAGLDRPPTKEELLAKLDMLKEMNK